MIVWSISTQAGKYSPERCWFICFLNDLKFWYIISYNIRCVFYSLGIPFAYFFGTMVWY